MEGDDFGHVAAAFINCVVDTSDRKIIHLPRLTYLQYSEENTSNRHAIKNSNAAIDFAPSHTNTRTLIQHHIDSLRTDHLDEISTNLSSQLSKISGSECSRNAENKSPSLTATAVDHHVVIATDSAEEINSNSENIDTKFLNCTTDDHTLESQYNQA
ncbi:hypothetical protein TrispH2_001808 [Trichoplax sp. H2]|nr:hypothetical protein TrispH2_001808 [Trichoplax sp. H2]|eukprot:RDD46009.1 hypothetical protein TrispH2_001808 [Trichoplax sp. H2]